MIVTIVVLSQLEILLRLSCDLERHVPPARSRSHAGRNSGSLAKELLPESLDKVLC